MDPSPGRGCPLSYRYGVAAFHGAAALAADTLWIAGGLYGNRYALQSLLEAVDAEPGTTALIFNGDFHWFDAEPAEFERIDATVAGFPATRGNVETEVADPAAGAGCGCAYPDWVGDAAVERSNAIIARLRAAARASGRDLARLASLPMTLVAEVGGERFGIATRISTRPARNPLYGARCGAVHVEAMPVAYDARAWEKRFVELWPAGTDAHLSYYERMVSGPAFERAA